MKAGEQLYRLQYLPLFWDDLNAAVSYISDVLQAPESARRLVDETEIAILNHLKMPRAAITFRTTRERDLPYYWFRVGNYMVFYVVFDDIMEVRRFLYNARNLDSMIPQKTAR